MTPVRRIAIALAVLIVVLLVGSQLLLPGLAERRVRDDLRSAGQVRDVEVRAFPALKLLVGRADRVDVRIGESRAGTGRLSDLIADAEGVETLDARIEVLRLGALVLRDVRLDKEGDRLDGRATLTREALQAAVPAGLGFRPVAAGDGQLLFEATAGLLGVQARIRARLAAQDGALVIAPEGIPFGGLATLTVFRDPRIAMTSVGATEGPGGYALTTQGRLREPAG